MYTPSRSGNTLSQPECIHLVGKETHYLNQNAYTIVGKKTHASGYTVRTNNSNTMKKKQL